MSDQSIQLPLPLPEAVQPWLTLNLEFHVIICHSTGCKGALTPRAVCTHLRDKHQVQFEIRQQLAEYLKQWQWQYDYQTIPLPLDASLPLPGLPVLNGFQCKSCSYKTTNRSIIRKHCNIQHNQQRLKDYNLFTAVQMQTWFKEKRARYWVVEDATRQSREDSNGSGSGRDTTIKAEIADWIMKQEESQAELDREILTTERDPWLRGVHWDEVLAGSQHDLVRTAAFATTATATEPDLVRLIQSWERILQRCLTTLAAIGKYKDILKWWVSPKIAEPKQVPFELLEKASLRQYSQTFQRLLCYILRVAPDRPEDQSETGAVFSDQQWLALRKIREVLQQPVAVVVAEDQPLDVALMGLIISLLAQDMCQLTAYESPVMHYLAVRGINPRVQRFHTAPEYTPILAQMLWMIRLLMLEVAVSEQGWPKLGLKSRRQTGAVAGAVAERIDYFRKSFLCEGSYSVASTILTQLAYGQSINRVQPSESNIHWAANRETVFYEGKGVAMAKVRDMYQELTIELEKLLYELLFHQHVPSVPLPQLVDCMGSAQQFRAQGYSFIDHPDNARWKKSWEFLWAHMLLEKGKWRLIEECRGSGSGSVQLQWADQRCKAYLARERQFLLKLMVAMHFTGGQPARSSELGSIKVQNSMVSNRNIFVINGRVAVVTTYDKSLKRRGKVEYVFRCFPDRLSQVIAQYLVYVLPFSRILARTKGDFLFTDERGPWIKEELSRAVAVATAKHLGVRLTVAGWRQVAIAIGDEHLRRASRIWKQDQDEAPEEDSDAEAEQSIFEQILVRQSAHGSRTASLHYAVDGAFLNRLGPDLINVYSQASRAWHAFLHLESKGAAVAVAVAKRPASPAQHDAKRPRLEASIALQGLQKILGPGARPRSEGQAHALELVHTATATQPQIIVLGTGSGKSLLFFSVAAMATHQTVIVVVPFAALVDDLIARARKYQLTCEEWQWQQREWKFLPQLLVVSADRAVEGDFLHFAKGLELSKQLAHVFFDECHVAVTDTSYRAKLRELWQLRYLQCQFTCLTATLLPILEPVLRANLLLATAQLYRQSTIRRTIRYRVIECQRGLWETAEPVIRGLPLPLGSRGVIYVRSYIQGESVAEEMDCPFYKATATDKQELLKQWAGGSGGWIVATGALGTGIDIPGIVYIIHLGRPYGLTSFMQQAGRGGRAGEISDSIVILPSSGSGRGLRRFDAPRQELVNIYSIEAQDEAALTEYLESGHCRQAVLAKHLDSDLKGTDCITTDSIPCDRCQEPLEQGGSQVERSSSRGSGGLESGAEAIHRAYQDNIRRDEQLDRFHQLLHTHCIYCQLLHIEGEEYSHRHSDCPHAADQNCSIEAYRQWRLRLQLAPRNQCFRCGLSQSVCTAIEEQTACIYPHLMLPGLFFLQQVGQLDRICRAVGFGGGAEWQWQWMNGHGEEGLGGREINWMRVWRRVAKNYIEMEDSKRS